MRFSVLGPAGLRRTRKHSTFVGSISLCTRKVKKVEMQIAVHGVLRIYLLKAFMNE